MIGTAVGVNFPLPINIIEVTSNQMQPILVSLDSVHPRLCSTIDVADSAFANHIEVQYV